MRVLDKNTKLGETNLVNLIWKTTACDRNCNPEIFILLDLITNLSLSPSLSTKRSALEMEVAGLTVV